MVPAAIIPITASMRRRPVQYSAKKSGKRVAPNAPLVMGERNVPLRQTRPEFGDSINAAHRGKQVMPAAGFGNEQQRIGDQHDRRITQQCFRVFLLAKRDPKKKITEKDIVSYAQLVNQLGSRTAA